MTAPDTVPFQFFDFVWMVIDEDGQSPGMGQVIGIMFKPAGTVIQVQWSCDRSAFHYPEELTKTKPVSFIA